MSSRRMPRFRHQRPMSSFIRSRVVSALPFGSGGEDRQTEQGCVLSRLLIYTSVTMGSMASRMISPRQHRPTCRVNAPLPEHSLVSALDVSPAVSAGPCDCLDESADVELGRVQARHRADGVV